MIVFKYILGGVIILSLLVFGVILPLRKMIIESKKFKKRNYYEELDDEEKKEDIK